jgi:hypothetical protein
LRTNKSWQQAKAKAEPTHGFGLFLLRMRWLCGSAASDEVHDNRDHGKQQKQMNEQPCGVEHEEAAEPQHNQNNCEYQKHRQSCFLTTKETSR